MNSQWKRWVWQLVKIALVIGVFVFIGRQFANDLSQLREADEIPWRPGWWVSCAGFYLVGLFPSAWFWRRLLWQAGYPVPLFAAVRAHYIAQLGKYVPGKALAVLMRAGLIRSQGVPFGVSVIVTFYEVLTSMAAGALVAALIYMIDPPIISAEELKELTGAEILQYQPIWIGIAVIGVCGVPIFPVVFNFIVQQLSKRFKAIDRYQMPPMGIGTLALGLTLSGITWWMLGLSCWALLQAVVPNPPELTLATWAQCTAAIGFATTIGFVIIFIPGGLVVREFLLLKLLSNYGPSAFISLSAIALRLVWIVAEAGFGLIAYLCKPASRERPNETSGSSGVNTPS